MKKILIILSAIILILLLAFGIFYFFGNGKERVSDFFTDNSFGSFFDIDPQSKNDFINTPIDALPVEPQEQGPYVAPILRQISFEPISGYTYYSTTSTTTSTTITIDNQEIITEALATSTAIRFQERVTGHIYDVFEFIQAPQKISNITEQQVYATIFSNNKDRFIFQRPIFNNEQIQSTLATLSFSTSTGVQMDTTVISNNITDFIFNKISNTLVYSVKQGNVSNLYTSSVERTNEKLITSLSFNEFLIDTINGNEVLITTKASRNIPGYAYTLNTTTGSLNKILGNINGLLVKVSPDKKYYLYSQSEQTRPGVRAYKVDKNETSLISIDTLPSEKCVFSQINTSEIYCFGELIYRSGIYPDDWYKGKIFNMESLYKVNLEDGVVEFLYDFEGEGLLLDAMNVQITNNDIFIVFQNKYDLTLWSIDLSRLQMN